MYSAINALLRNHFGTQNLCGITPFCYCFVMFGFKTGHVGSGVVTDIVV